MADVNTTGMRQSLQDENFRRQIEADLDDARHRQHHYRGPDQAFQVAAQRVLARTREPCRHLADAEPFDNVDICPSLVVKAWALAADDAAMPGAPSRYPDRISACAAAMVMSVCMKACGCECSLARPGGQRRAGHAYAAMPNCRR